MKAARLSWFERQLDLDLTSSCSSTRPPPTRRWSAAMGEPPRGARCRVAVPFGHWKTITVTAGLRTSGLTATALFDGPMTGARFRGYVEQTLVPALRPATRSCSTICPPTRSAAFASASRRRERGCSTSRPIPQLHPIELAFAKLKAILRSEAARTTSDLWDTIRRAFKRFTPAEMPPLSRRRRLRRV